MRMRRKKNLEEKLLSVEDRLSILRSDDLNFKTSVQKKEYIDIDALFEKSLPLKIEVGCGKGRFLLESAKRHPDFNFIGIEAEKNVAYMAAKKLLNEGVKNAFVLCTLAEYLPKYLKDGCTDTIFLNFSCPYPKSDYESHRLTSSMFLKIYDDLLVPDGTIIQKTDNMKFFEYSVVSLSSYGYVIKDICLDLSNSSIKDNIVTEYEERFIKEGLPIYRLEAVKRHG